MIYQISDACIMCGACVEVCPEKAIKEGATKYEIDPAKCKGCGNCADVCPMSAPEQVQA